jgi:beta-lactamase regulating signal transducer with metallopeptidase domain
VSDALTGVFWTVTEASLRASAALGFVLLARRAAAAWLPASARHALLLVAVLALPLVPLAVGAIPGWEIAAALPVADPADGTVRPPGFGRTPWPLVMAIAWAVGAAILLARLGSGFSAVARLRRSARRLEAPEWPRLAERVAGRLDLRRKPVLLLGRYETSPMTWGILRPVVLLPPSATGWSEDRRFAVLAHELAHARRAEPLALVACEVVRAFHWFNPLVWVALARLRRESELAADELALRAGIRPVDYAGHLVAVVRGREATAPAAVGLASNRDLRDRVAALLEPGGPRRGIGARALAVVGLAVVFASAVPRLAVPDAAILLAARHGIAVELSASILDAAAREGIDPDVAFGLVRVESAFDPRRVSDRGAIGLTQVLPSTADEVAPGIPRPALFEPTTNLQVGFRYLRGMLDREGGDVRGALLAYALGPARLDEIRRSGRTPPTDYPDRVLGTGFE